MKRKDLAERSDERRLAVSTPAMPGFPTRLSSVLAELQSQLDMLDRLGDPLAPFTPVADVEETDDAYLVEIELPGVKRRDIDIQTVGRRLVVTGVRHERERAGILRRRQRAIGEFRYEIELPTEIDADAVTAGYDDGVLSVRIPKPAHDQPRRVPIT